ncbi:MAG TPA: class I SAM-dependent methyltransferase [Solirubrobacteraceae bacterium]|jgi:SAM-dependent methyltransferase|nr:class I SAM-dependent methyltransferase [Solirubrobacteraceae bacterium]
MPDPGELQAFYDRAYSGEGERGLLYARWRALGAKGKADHVIELCSRLDVEPTSTLEVGCGDGALLAELHARRFGGTLRGVEITQAAVDIAATRSEIDSVELYDGEHLPAAGGQYDLGIASHVLEHVPQPAALVREMARACRIVVVEVPLEDNLSARRGFKREHASEIGHLQRLSRSSTRAIVAQAGLRVAAELEDPLPRAVHVFFARDRQERALCTAKWVVRTAVHRAAPGSARRLLTLHYACLCLPRE